MLVDVMARVYTWEILQPLNEKQLIKFFLKTQEQKSKAINTLTKGIKKNTLQLHKKCT